MSLNVATIAKSMLTAAKGSLKKHWPDVKEYVKAEAKKTAETLAMIEKLALNNQITPHQAKLLLEMQKNSVTAVLLTTEGLGLLAVEAAISAALGAVRGTVNKAIGFALL